jgi:hypothetical protein
VQSADFAWRRAENEVNDLRGDGWALKMTQQYDKIALAGRTEPREHENSLGGLSLVNANIITAFSSLQPKISLVVFQSTVTLTREQRLSSSFLAKQSLAFDKVRRERVPIRTA